MTDLDQFAKAAMQGEITRVGLMNWDEDDLQLLARCSYIIAEAMLTESRKRQPEPESACDDKTCRHCHPESVAK